MGIFGVKYTNGLPWTEEREDQLRKLWDTSLGTKEIAETIGGITKGAVIGKAHRLKLPSRSTSPTGKVAKKRAPEPRPEIEPNPPGRPLPTIRRVGHGGRVIQPASQPVKLPPRIYMDVLEAKLIPKKQRKTVFELRNDTCRWPFNHPCDPDFFFCGAPEANLESGKPYCPLHSKQASI